MKMKKGFAVLISLLLLMTAFISPFAVVRASSLDSGNIVVRIQYVFNDADQTVAAQPYEANVPAGYDRVESVASPDVQGYEPDQRVVPLDFKQFSRDTTLTVKYYPREVLYQVEHQVENLSKDAFVTHSKDKLSGYVNSVVTATPKALDGFTAITPYQTEKVPAEGMLNLIVKYTRNIYTLSYDTDGGSYLPSEQRVFEEQLTKPADPVKPGYTFGGWEPALPDTMPAKDLQLKAKWLEYQTPFKYAYFLQNADDDDYTFIGYTDKSAETNSPVVIPSNGAGPENIALFPVRNFAGFNFTDPSNFDKYFVFNEAKTQAENAGKTISGDGKTIVPLYFTRREYTVAFGNSPDYYNDTNAFFPEIKKDGKVYTRDNPYTIKVRYGQDFSDLIPTEKDISNLKSGEWITGKLYVKGNGYGSWMTKKPPYVFNAHMAYCAPQTVVDLKQGKNYPYTQYIALIIGKSAHKLDIYEYLQNPDGSYDELTEPTRTEPLESGAWYYSGPAYKGFLNDSNYMDYYQHSNEQKGSGFLIRRNGKPSLSKGDLLLNPDGTLKEKITYDWDRNADGIVHVYLARKSFPIRFYLDPDQESKDLADEVLYGAPIVNALPSPDEINQNRPKSIPANYEFKGWYKDPVYKEKLKDDAVMDTKPVTLFAKWEEPTGDITVTVKEDNGSPDYTLTVRYNDPIAATKLGTPKKPGYTFIGWYVFEENSNNSSVYRMNRDYIVSALSLSSFFKSMFSANNKQPANSSNTLYDFSRKLTHNITLLAKYRKNTSAAVTVKYLDENDKPVAAEKIFKDLPVGFDYTYQAALVDGMLPDSRSKDITVDADSDKNILVFRYKPFTEIDYKVRYVTKSLDSKGNPIEKEIASTENVTTDRNIDTRNYKPIKGYTPLTLKQTLHLSQRAEDNIMTFVYKEDTPDISKYKIEYYFADKGSYSINESMTKELSGKVGETVTLNEEMMPEYINGYKLNTEKSTGSAEITSFDTLVMKLYYDKVTVPSNTGTDKNCPSGNAQNTNIVNVYGSNSKMPSTGEQYHLILPISLTIIACALTAWMIVLKKKNHSD